jgi:glycerophosphoryl diester phosphodiesterase
MLHVSAVTAVAVAMGAAGPAYAARRGNFQLVAHRGYHAVATENTIGALDAAVDKGAPAVETDLRLTSDNYMLVMHDPTLRRTSSCRGWIDERTKASIRQRCRARDGQNVPFATDMLRASHNHFENLLMEIKPDRQHRWNKAKLTDLADLINRREMGQRVMVSSMTPSVLSRMETVAPELPTMLISNTAPTVPEVEAAGADNVSGRASDLTPQSVAALNATGHRVYGRSSNIESDWDTYRNVGVDGVITDAVPQYRAWSNRTG